MLPPLLELVLAWAPWNRRAAGRRIRTSSHCSHLQGR